jgi:hypothetical protein
MQGGTLDRDRVFIQFDGNGARGNFSRAVVCGNHKLNVDFFKDEIFFELYDLARDPQEMNNLAFTAEAEVRELLPSLIEHMVQTEDRLSLSAEAYDTFLTGYAPFRERVESKISSIQRI